MRSRPKFNRYSYKGEDVRTQSQKELADYLFDIGAVKFDFEKGFRLKMHETHPERPCSPIYMNLRTDKHPVPEKRGPLDDKALDMIGEEFRVILKDLNWGFDLFADIPDAGEPFGDQIDRVMPEYKDRHRLRLVKGHRPDGTRFISHIGDGEHSPRQRVLLVDELISGADTKLEAAGVLEREELVVWLILLLIDRCQGGVERLQEEGFAVSAVMTLTDMLSHYKSGGRINHDQWQKVTDYLELSKTW